MDGEEKIGWIATLWPLSIASAVWVCAAVATGGDGGLADSPMVLFPLAFTVEFVWWLFRVTYLAGKRR
jgi:hypothetical protein